MSIEHLLREKAFRVAPKVVDLENSAEEDMAAYQQGTKRQKAREIRDDYFQGIDKLEYNNMAGLGENTRYRHYNSTERVHNKTMEDWLKCSVPLTEFRSHGSDNHGRACRPWDDHSNTLENHKRCIKALFDFCAKLGLKYWTALDSDLVPACDNWDECRASWDEIVEYLVELNQRYHLKLLWLAPDLHSHARYTNGAFTSNDATSFTAAAAQIKKCLEVSQRLNAECVLIWPHKEGYNSVFHTDVAKEIKLFSKLLKITAEYKDRLNYRCQLLLMPYSNTERYNYNYRWQHWQDTVNRYMWDVTSCLYFLKNYNLERYFKVVTPPGHHMIMANVYNMLGGVTITNDFDQYNAKNVTLMMKCIVDQGSAPPAGISLHLSRREGDVRDSVTSHVRYIDALARGLRLACSLQAEQIFSKHLQQRYSTYHSGFGSRLVTNEISVEECEEYYKKNHGHSEPASAKCEHVELAFQRYIDTSDHI